MKSVTFRVSERSDGQFIVHFRDNGFGSQWKDDEKLKDMFHVFERGHQKEPVLHSTIEKANDRMDVLIRWKKEEVQRIKDAQIVKHHKEIICELGD